MQAYEYDSMPSWRYTYPFQAIYIYIYIYIPFVPLLSQEIDLSLRAVYSLGMTRVDTDEMDISTFGQPLTAFYFRPEASRYSHPDSEGDAWTRCLGALVVHAT